MWSKNKQNYRCYGLVTPGAMQTTFTISVGVQAAAGATTNAAAVNE